VATYGNLVNRVLTFVYRNFEGRVPVHKNTDPAGESLLAHSAVALKEIDGLLAHCSFKQAIKTAMAVAHEANRYLDEKSPWKVIKQDRQAAADSLYVAIVTISYLRTMLYPFLPFSSQKLHEYLGFKGRVEEYGWKVELPAGGQELVAPQPLFAKLDEKLADEETGRLGQPAE